MHIHNALEELAESGPQNISPQQIFVLKILK